MKCSFCGKELNEGVKFCAFCGTRVRSDVAQSPIEQEANVTDNAYSQAPRQSVDPMDASFSAPSFEETTEKWTANKKIILIVAAILVAAILLCSVAVGLSRGLSDNGYYMLVAIGAYISDAGDGYVCYDNGKLFYVGSDVKQAVLTADRTLAVVVTNDGSVYYRSIRDEKRSDIHISGAKNESAELISVCNNAVFYTVSSPQNIYQNSYQTEQFSTGEVQYDGVMTKTYYVYEFATGSMFQLGTSDEIDSIRFSLTAEISGETGAVAYARNGNIYVCGNGMGNEVMGRYDEDSDDVEIMSVSADGKAALWGVRNGDTSQIDIVMYFDGSSKILESFGEGESNSFAYAMNCPVGSSENFIVLSAEKIYIRMGKEIKQLTLPDAISSGVVYGIDGKAVSLSESFDPDDGFFVLTSNGESDDLYMVKADGQRKRLVSEIESFAVAEGMLVFEKNDTLSIANIDSANCGIEDITVIPKSSDPMSVQALGKYVYFTDGEGALYRYGIKEESTMLIHADVDSFIPSDDGKEVFFMTGVVTESSTAFGQVAYGDLMKYNEKDGHTMISESVLVGSVTDNLYGNVVEDGSFWYETYSAATDEGYRFNASYYDGKKSKLLVERIHS